MFDAPSAPLSPTPAPGARGAKLCGVWSIVASLTCVGLPIGFVLAIVALVQQAKAKRSAKDHPDFYEQPTATGLVTGIIGLVMPVIMVPFVGIVSAIAIPALLSQRARARDRAAMENMVGRTGDLAGQWDKQREKNTETDQIVPALETHLRQTAGTDKNPWNLAQPAYNFQINVVSGLDRDGIEHVARERAITLGQSLWILEPPQPDPFAGYPYADPQGQRERNPGYLVGVVLLQNEMNGERTVVKVVELE